MAEPALATTRGVDLATASKIIDTALGLARSRKLRPMTIAVLDSGGDLVAYKREDGTGIRRYDIVIGKAFGALVMNRPSRGIGAIAERLPMFVQTLAMATDGRVIPTPGGVLIKNQDGRIVGAVGSSGDDADADEAIAIAGVRAAGFVPEPAEPTGPAS
ncbi:MAG TPA: heme-binding protein [Stellaceae bacterium]|nr:heme-binding protein [Stellaceae bacterium]